MSAISLYIASGNRRWWARDGNAAVDYLYRSDHWLAAEARRLNEDEQRPTSFVEWGDPLKSYVPGSNSAVLWIHLAATLILSDRQRQASINNRLESTVHSWALLCSMTLVHRQWLSAPFWPVIDWWIFFSNWLAPPSFLNRKRETERQREREREREREKARKSRSFWRDSCLCIPIYHGANQLQKGLMNLGYQ